MSCSVDSHELLCVVGELGMTHSALVYEAWHQVLSGSELACWLSGSASTTSNDSDCSLFIAGG